MFARCKMVKSRKDTNNMAQNRKVLEEAYKKIIADKELQKKFVEAVAKNKLEKFLKDQKIEATVEEVKKYVIETFTRKDGELSKGELDLAAGGEKDSDEREKSGMIGFSFLTFGIGCLVSGLIDSPASDKCTL